MRRTSAITLAGVTVLALTVSACGREDAGSAAPETGKAVSSGAAKGTITMWAMGAEGENLPKLTKEFEAANPGVKVQVTAIPWDAAHDKFTTAITANKTPDVAMVGTTWMGEFAGMDALDPTPGEVDKSVFFDGAQKTTEVDGTSFGVPWYVETRLVYYRTDLAKKAGITTPPTDWDGLKTMAKAMQDKAGAKYGIGLQAGGTGSWQSVMPFAWSAGADLTKDGGKAYNFDSPEVLKATQYYQSFFTDGISDKAAPATPTTEPDFASGKVPMFISGPWMMSAVEKAGGGDKFKDKYDVFQIPADKMSSSFVGGSNLVVFKNTQNRDSSWKLVNWLSDPKTQVKWYGMSTDLPSVKSAWQDPALTADEKLATFGKQLETAQAPPSFPTWEQVVTSFDSELEKITKSGADPAASLKTVQKQAESIGTGN
ncbi:MAG TPA: sugar ABC transporter substrate-binding protein [Ornithinibacter sp.]|nr:sugar ABC transporter substrate-binding protein [Ornithinibacter sp.]